MNYNYRINNNQTKSPMLFHKSKLKKKPETNRASGVVFNNMSGKSFLNTFRKSTSKDKSNLKYKTSKNSPNSSLKKIEVSDEFKKISNDHKDTQPGMGVKTGISGVKKKSTYIYEDLFMKKIRKIYSKNNDQNNAHNNIKKSSSNLFNAHNYNNNSNINYPRDNKKYLHSGNISNMDISNKIGQHHIDNSSEENNLLFLINNNKNLSSINSGNSYGLLVNSSSLLGSLNNTNINEGYNINNNSNLNINNNHLSNNNNSNNISSPNSGNDTGFVSNYNLMKHIENKYEKINNNKNNNIDGNNSNSNINNSKPLIENNNNLISNFHKKTSKKQSSKVKTSSMNYFYNNKSSNCKYQNLYPKFMFKNGEDLSGITSNKKINNFVGHNNSGIGAYSEFTKLSKSSYPTKNNSNKSTLEKKRSKLYNYHNNHLNNNNNNNNYNKIICNDNNNNNNDNHNNNIYIDNNTSLQNQEDNINNNSNAMIMSSNRTKSKDNNLNIIENDNISNNSKAGVSNLEFENNHKPNRFNKSKSMKETSAFSQINNINIDSSNISNINENNDKKNTLYMNNNNMNDLIKSSQFDSNSNQYIINQINNNNEINNIHNNNIIINSKNISSINISNISNKQSKIEINNFSNSNSNRIRSNINNNINNNIQQPQYIEYISSANKNITTSSKQEKKPKKTNNTNNSNTNMNNSSNNNISNNNNSSNNNISNNNNNENNINNNNNSNNNKGIKIIYYNNKKTKGSNKMSGNKPEIHNRSNSGLIITNQLEMLLNDIIFKKKLTLKKKDFNTSLNSKHSRSKHNIDDSYNAGNNTSRPETIKARLIKNSVPISSCQSPGGKINENSLKNFRVDRSNNINNINDLVNKDNNIENESSNINSLIKEEKVPNSEGIKNIKYSFPIKNKFVENNNFDINKDKDQDQDKESERKKYSECSSNNKVCKETKLQLFNDINEQLISSKENLTNKLNNSLEDNQKNKTSNTSRCFGYKEKEKDKDYKNMSSNLNKQKTSYMNNNNLSLIEKKIIKNLKEGIKLDFMNKKTKNNLLNKKESNKDYKINENNKDNKDNNKNNNEKYNDNEKDFDNDDVIINSEFHKQMNNNQSSIKEINSINAKLIKSHLHDNKQEKKDKENDKEKEKEKLSYSNMLSKDINSNLNRKDSKDKEKEKEKEKIKIKEYEKISSSNTNKKDKNSITPPKTEKYIKKNSSDGIPIFSSNKKKDKDKDKEKLTRIDNNYNNFKEMLCEPKSSQKIKEENIRLTTTASHDCGYYKNEMERISTFIKNYYDENGTYPDTQIDFYLYGRLIGHGAFGKVNLSLHVASGRLVAIKSFAKKNIKNSRAKQKIKHEIQMLSKLRHPFISQILDSFETEKHIFIVMEYICGDLLGFIRKRGKLSESVTKVIFKQIIEGLKYIHRKKIVHRDIKLDNILIDLTNTVKICDFGVSKKINKNDIMYDHCGTPAYIAPEIFENKGYEGYSCDIWSAGVTLYYMLGGVQPFYADSIKELEKIILEGKYDKLDDVSDEANDLIEGMLQLDPKKRLTEDEILNHPWIVNINLNNRSKLNLFTDAEKILLSKFDVDYLSSEKADLIENFTLKNLETNNEMSKAEGNTKSVIFAPYNSYIEPNEKNIRVSFEEDAIYKELEVKNDICKFGYRVQQANIQYELSNNQDFDNGVIKTQKEEEFKNQNDKMEKMDEEKILSARLSGLNSPRVKSANDSFEESEKIELKKDLLKEIEKNVGYDKKYMISCIKKNVINYASATYYLLSREDQYNFK